MTVPQIIDLKIPLSQIPASIGNPDRHLMPWINPGGVEKISYRILKKSVDARKRNYIVFNYRVELFPDLSNSESFDYPFRCDKTNALKHPVIVGAGPAGLFAAWLLARAGACPVILERGQYVGVRGNDIEKFHAQRVLNPESNYLFGEGGAGTYSDGKLYTRIKDPRCDFVLKLMTRCGAPEEIAWDQRPHIGSDILPGMVAALRHDIEHMGGIFRWGTRCESLLMEGERCGGVILSTGEKIEAPGVLLAMGHSARDFIRELMRLGISYSAKSFQVGCRVEHSQEFVNWMQYGTKHCPSPLPIPEYHIVSRPTTPGLLGAVSFCMCPGGEIIPAAHVDGMLSTNGMSPNRRNMPYANAAVIVSLENRFPKGDEALNYLEMLERNVFQSGGGDWTCPAQDVVPFIRGERGLYKPDRTSYRMGLVSGRLDKILPPLARRSLQSAFCHFDKNAPGFAAEGRLVGLETRISAPIRFDRNPETLRSASHHCLWIGGEGAGYAGGIMSAAVDGLKLAESMLGMPPHLDI